MRVPVAAFVAAVTCVLVLAAPATAATLTVTSAADSGAGSLRDVIAAATAGDIVEIAAGVNPVLSSGEIVVQRDVTIRGQGARATTISAGGSSRIFRIAGGGVIVEELTLTGGRAANGAPGESSGPGGSGDDGGAILNQQGAGLLLRRAIISNSRAGSGGAGGSLLGLTGGNGGNGGRGGAIANFGSLVIDSSTLIGNRGGNGAAPGSGLLGDGAPGAGGSGGAVYVNGGASRSTLLENVTIADNTAGAAAVGGVAGGGGAVFADGGGANRSIAIRNATIANNRGGGGAGAAGGGIASRASGKAFVVENSIIAGNAATGGANCSGAGIVDGGNNIARPRGGCPASFGNADPKLTGAPADNGGPTPTFNIGFDGSAVNQIAASGENCPAADQRGVERPQGGRCDIGAVELLGPTCEDVNLETRPGRTVTVKLNCRGPGKFTYATTSTPEHGELSGLKAKTGSVQYTAGRVFRGEDSFTYKATNRIGDSRPATVRIIIGGPPPPPNNFSFGKVKLNRNKGTAKLPVKVPGRGRLRMSGKGVRNASKQVKGKGTVGLLVKPTRKASRRLRRSGATTVLAKVKFIPKGGFPRNRTKRVLLRVNEFSVPI